MSFLFEASAVQIYSSWISLASFCEKICVYGIAGTAGKYNLLTDLELAYNRVHLVQNGPLNFWTFTERCAKVLRRRRIILKRFAHWWKHFQKSRVLCVKYEIYCTTKIKNWEKCKLFSFLGKKLWRRSRCRVFGSWLSLRSLTLLTR